MYSLYDFICVYALLLLLLPIPLVSYYNILLRSKVSVCMCTFMFLS